MIVVLITAIAVMMFFNPVHYLNLYLLKLRFAEAQKIQPAETNFIWQKSYIGGLGSNGNGDCNYVVGELRSFSGPKKKVVEQYKKVLDNNENVGILFMDDDSWPLDSILWDWRSDFLIQNYIEEGKYYIIYLTKEFPSLLDLRCQGY